MSNNFMLSKNEVNSNIVKNILLMLQRRNMISDYEGILNSLGDLSGNSVFDFKNNSDKYSIYIINSKLNSIISKSPLDDYLNSNLDVRKFVIIESPSKRAVKQLYESYNNCEFFFVHEMIHDLCSKHFIPEHKILNDKDKSELLKRFKLNEFSRIFNYDVMARYYNAKVNDIFKILRPNITSGYSVFYRVVVNGKIDNLFP